MCYFGVCMLRDLMLCFMCVDVYGCGCGDRERMWFVDRGGAASLFAGWGGGGDPV
jgi:hypothetical protein